MAQHRSKAIGAAEINEPCEKVASTRLQEITKDSFSLFLIPYPKRGPDP